MEDNETTAGWWLTVDAERDGMRLDRFVADRIPRLSRARAARCAVHLQTDPLRTLKKSAPVHAGMQLFVERPCPDHFDPTLQPQILFQQDGLLVLEKPTGLAVHPTASRFKNTVLYWLNLLKLKTFEPVHRLDAETSGLLLCAEQGAAERELKSAFLEHRIEKHYLAITKGIPAQTSWIETTPLAMRTDSPIHIKMYPAPKGPTTDAQTAFQVLEIQQDLALIQASPLTGRQHQIRAHLALAGCPILGDKLYGPDETLFLTHLERPLTEEEQKRAGHSRCALHASELSFMWQNRLVSFHSPLPEDLRGLFTNSANNKCITY